MGYINLAEKRFWYNYNSIKSELRYILPTSKKNDKVSRLYLNILRGYLKLYQIILCLIFGFSYNNNIKWILPFE